MKKLNVGCGRDILPEYVNLDISPDVGADLVADIRYGIPAGHGEYDEVLCNNVLTQISDPQDFVRVMNELWRVTKHGGKTIVRVPLATDPCAFQDPMDVRRFTEESFTYMDSSHRRFKQYGNHYGFMPWHTAITDNNGKQMTVELTPTLFFNGDPE